MKNKLFNLLILIGLIQNSQTFGSTNNTEDIIGNITTRYRQPSNRYEMQFIIPSVVWFPSEGESYSLIVEKIRVWPFNRKTDTIEHPTKKNEHDKFQILCNNYVEKPNERTGTITLPCKIIRSSKCNISHWNWYDSHSGLLYENRLIIDDNNSRNPLVKRHGVSHVDAANYLRCPDDLAPGRILPLDEVLKIFAMAQRFAQENHPDSDPFNSKDYQSK